MDNEEDREFMRQCEELAENTQNPADKRRWQQVAASWRRRVNRVKMTDSASRTTDDQSET